MTNALPIPANVRLARMIKGRGAKQLNREIALSLIVETVPVVLTTTCRLLENHDYRKTLGAENAVMAQRHREKMAESDALSRHRRDHGDTMSQEVRDAYDMALLQKLTPSTPS